MNYAIWLFLALAFMAAGDHALAGSDTGMYWGGSMGQASLDASNTDFDIDDDASGYKLIVGYNFGWIPTIDLSVEADYRDFGSFEGSEDAVESELTSFDVYGVAGFKVGPLGIFAKLGYADTDVDTAIEDLNVSRSESNTSYGLGAKIGLGSLAVRAEYEVFDIDDVDDVTMTSLGIIFTF